MEERQERRAAAAGLDALHEFAARFAAPSSGATRTLDAVAAQVLAAFRQAGVDALLLKGRALAILLYRAGEQRDYSDIDLLVAPRRSRRRRSDAQGAGLREREQRTGGRRHRRRCARGHVDPGYAGVERSGDDRPAPLATRGRGYAGEGVGGARGATYVDRDRGSSGGGAGPGRAGDAPSHARRAARSGVSKAC